MDKRERIENVVQSLRRVNVQGSIFGQTIAIRLGLSESDIDALELLIDTGAATAGRLSEVMGLTTGAVTRVIDRLEQAGYVRRETDPSDRRRVVVEVVPERDRDGAVIARVARAGVRRGDRPLFAGAAGGDQRLPDADGGSHPDRSDAVADRRATATHPSRPLHRSTPHLWPGSRPLVCRSGRARRTFAFGPDGRRSSSIGRDSTARRRQCASATAVS